YYVDFVGTAAEQLLAKSVLASDRVVQLSSPQEVTDIFEWLQRKGTSETRVEAEICAALLPVLVMTINQHAVPYGALDSRALETYQRVKRIIEGRFLSLRSAEEAARACHVDRSYLSRVFKRLLESRIEN